MIKGQKYRVLFENLTLFLWSSTPSPPRQMRYIIILNQNRMLAFHLYISKCQGKGLSCFKLTRVIMPGPTHLRTLPQLQLFIILPT